MAITHFYKTADTDHPLFFHIDVIVQLPYQAIYCYKNFVWPEAKTAK